MPILDQLSGVRRQLDNGTLNTRTLRAVDVLRSASTQERVIDSISNRIANLIVTNVPTSTVRFVEVTSVEDWRGVRELRKRCYPMSLPYLIDVLDADGSERHDRHSFVYAAYLKGNVVATIRATAYPYETLDHVGEAALGAFLGTRWKTEYIEWGRLLVDCSYGKMRLAPALITYAGLRLLAMTPYRRYFGYTKPNVRDTLSRFSLEPDVLHFEIPSRGSHRYLLTRGSIGGALAREVPKWLRKVGGSFTGRGADSTSQNRGEP